MSNSQNDDRNEKNDGVLWWGGLLGSFFLARYVNDFDPESAKKIFLAGIVWYVGFPIYESSRGDTLKQTWDNFTGCLYLIGIFLIVALVFGILMPKSCTREIEETPEATDLYFRR
ncbi:MAG: hypothetical protein KGZ69_11065 [Methylomonas sp.]|nr:hypothetical protein [Methylomonas sp.]